MNWILDHFQLVIAAAGGVAWWLKQHRQAQAGAEAPPPHQEATFADPALAERTRKIREEIQRKIEQRARGYASERPRPPRREPAPPPLPGQETVVTPAMLRRAATQVEAPGQTGVPPQPAAPAEQLRQADEMKPSSARRVRFETDIADQARTAAGTEGGTLGDDLRDPVTLRRAFILREVLGPPVALRR